MLTKVINTLEVATKLPVEPFETDEIKDCILYKYYPVSDDGAVAQHTIEIRLITNTIERAEIYKKQIIKALVSVGDDEKIEGILSCELNGGGSLKEYGTNTIHSLMYFNLTTRSDNYEQ